MISVGENFFSANIVSIVVELLTIFGLWGILRKCGVKPWWALVPAGRFYMLSRCAGREPEGRTLLISEIVRWAAIIIQAALYYAEQKNQDISETMLIIDTLMVGVQIAAEVLTFIFMIRINLGLIQVFERRKRWIVLMILIQSVVYVIWGWSKRFQPGWKMSDLEAQTASLSGATAMEMDEGLTVNLEERTVTEFFQKHYLLRDIHMYIKQGSMVLLLGGSGAGKTTFLNAINGYEPAKAKVTLNGTDIYEDYKKMQYEIGFVPQQDLMRTNDTVWNTLMDAALLRLPLDLPAEKRKERVVEVMRIFGLEPVKDSLVSKLSGGQRKRLSISMEFLSNPSLFILDEPDSGLDGVMARELMEQLRKIADAGKIVIVITHTPDRVIDLFDDVIVLAKDKSLTGRLAFYGSIRNAYTFFGKKSMEQIVRSINRQEEGGEGRADEFIEKYAEVQHG